MMKWILVLVLLVAAWLYGWRFYPQAILDYPPFKTKGPSFKKPILTHDPKNNVLAKWHPADFLDRFSGEREHKMQEQARQQK